MNPEKIIGTQQVVSQPIQLGTGFGRQPTAKDTDKEIAKKEMLHSSYWFRSSDLRVMSPAGIC
jgi:hypothetical protein